MLVRKKSARASLNSVPETTIHKSVSTAKSGQSITKMGRKPLGDRALTEAEKQRRQRIKQAAKLARYEAALKLIQTIKAARDAREIARRALEGKEPD